MVENVMIMFKSQKQLMFGFTNEVVIYIELSPAMAATLTAYPAKIRAISALIETHSNSPKPISIILHIILKSIQTKFS